MKYEHVFLTLTVIKLCQSRISEAIISHCPQREGWEDDVLDWSSHVKSQGYTFKAKHWPRTINPEVAITGSTLFLPYQRHNVAIREPERLLMCSNVVSELQRVKICPREAEAECSIV